ncbi:hypothetical protein GUJ93_ZPchr0003g18286 [Zizania palustris]|uniref:Uncharacterized protein n=1 Tax=Zizania palustris TaxID=103762 RepID=A0A8J5V6G7_ZIZPA|nr:hypothetical protein GUJ93_ZPchr0003g18286 [Zizania palustris]
MAAALRQHHHQIKAPTPTWLLLKATPPARPAAPYSSPLLLSPSVWQKAQDAKKSEADGRHGGGDGLPASPRISCMGKIKGRPRGCSGARGRQGARDTPATEAHRGGGKPLLERLTLGLFGRRRGRTSSRACSKVRDVPSTTSSSSVWSSRGCPGGASPALCTLDSPLPVVRRPVVNDNAPTLWERRRGVDGAKPLETLQLA